MRKFTDEHKKEINMDYFEMGVHKVKITSVVFGQTDDEKDYVDITVTDANESKDGRARLWFTTDKAVGYSLSILRGIFTHNTPEAKRDKMKERFNAVKDSEELDKLCQSLEGKEAWFEVSEDPSRTYQNDKGETKNSINRNIYGYEPEPKQLSAEQLVSRVIPGSKEVKTSDGEDEDVMADF